ncbi:MAG TPA: DUF433 domain-containing protein [Myxococcota bacterium]|nr:DUF433 domain-containing protein [Myxococcota bacterium]
MSTLYGGKDPRDIAVYSLSDASWYLKLPRSTLRGWVAQNGVIAPASPGLLSFNNLVECYTLSAMRRDHGLKLDRIRTALRYVSERMGKARPLLHSNFMTDGLDIFVERGVLVNASGEGQLPIQEVVRGYLQRVEWDSFQAPIRLFPLTRPGAQADAPRRVVIDPRISFGRPVVAGTGVPTEVVAGRFRAGESPAEIAEDFGILEEDVLESLRWEGQKQAA